MKYKLFFIVVNILLFSGQLSAQELKIWANEGGEKITQDELRYSDTSGITRNSVWDGNSLNLSAAQNEVVGSELIIEAATGANNVTVTLPILTGPGGVSLSDGGNVSKDLFDWRGREIELFYVRYLQIKGLSLNGFERYDERHIPVAMRRPFSGAGFGQGTWIDRPHHDKFYPDILVPIEAIQKFNIAARSNQAIWIDIFVPKGTPSGMFSGQVEIRKDGTLDSVIPVRLKVFNFELPDIPTSKTMVVYSPLNVNKRFFGVSYINTQGDDGPRSIKIRDRYFQLAHRHKISLVDTNYDFNGDSPSPYEWLGRLDGSLFTSASGYEGPGAGTGNNIFSIGTYGSWSWSAGTKEEMQLHTDNWEKWFQINSPQTDRFLYLTDESRDYAQTEKWATWIKENPGPGGKLKSYATVQLPDAFDLIPSLSIVSSTIYLGVAEVWDAALNKLKSDEVRQFFLYNGHRPASGSFVMEDDGIALREIPWGQFKKGVDRWYYWEGTYYNNYLGGLGETNLFQNAHTFGGGGGENSSTGQTGWNYSNGDGVLFYPGSDMVYPDESYGIEGPIASLRLKLWRRGIQDADYLALASRVDAEKTRNIINRMVPNVLWEYGVEDPEDPTYKRGDVSWPTNPDLWEAARTELAVIIESGNLNPSPTPTSTSRPISTSTTTPTSTSVPAPTSIPTATITSTIAVVSSTVTATRTAVSIATVTFTNAPAVTPNFPTVIPPTTFIPAVLAIPTLKVLQTSVPSAPPTMKPEFQITATPLVSPEATFSSANVLKGKLKVSFRYGYIKPRFYKEKIRKSVSLLLKTTEGKRFTLHLARDLSFSRKLGIARLLSLRIKRGKATPVGLILKIVISSH